jgi:hypothetical protein
MVAISPAGKQARDAALASIVPIISDLVDELGAERVKSALPILRELRVKLGSVD